MIENTTILDEILTDLKTDCDITSYAFFKDDGRILSSKMSEENTKKMGKIVKFYSRQMKVNNYFVQETGSVQLILYRISSSVFFVFISKTALETIINSLTRLFEKYSEKLNKFFQETPDNFQQIVKYILISQSREMGPEPVAYYPPDIDDSTKLKITLKSMLLLTAEREGAIRGIPATIPFIEYYAMGVIFLFDIPDPKARGGAYDSCISILVDESYRPAIYENMYALENTCIEAADMMKKGQDLNSIMKFILAKLRLINLRKAHDKKKKEIESLMKEQLKIISRDLK
ncbi:MAG: hypothetical protein ACTSWN_01315 [Promethearchaeota archaeon]